MTVSIEQDEPVRLDPRLTASVLAHLLENAAQYAPAGSPIDLNVGMSGDGLELMVRDHGPGIAAADLPHLFERFDRGAAAKTRASGTGMGLWIVRGLLAVEQGRVRAESCSDGGARFTIVVPAVMKEAVRVFLVDDEVAIQRAVAPLLRSRSYEVDVAGTGADAPVNRNSPRTTSLPFVTSQSRAWRCH